MRYHYGTDMLFGKANSFAKPMDAVANMAAQKIQSVNAASCNTAPQCLSFARYGVG